MNVLVVAAHPDDEVLGCGGTIARHVAQGDRVQVLILGEGATSRAGSRAAGDVSMVSSLRDAARAAGDVLGVSGLRHLGLPDNRFDSVDLLDVIKHVEELAQEVEPECVYTHHPGDLNVDHAITARAVTTALRPVPGAMVREILCFEVLSSTEWSFNMTPARFLPNVFVDISGCFERKLEAMRCYSSEMRPFPHPRSEEALAASAARWGATVGCECAEAFELVRSVR